ncbi:ABC transporter permease [Mesorhizobium sp. B2-6-1]|uniref:ABC transporter permease n=1 Tax=Mesorhizobium sp. B2-6-1 TaxID=2589916 RepID=UPI00112CF772|nr:ABC transporter permease [Mesorhizobium sp. B2-6-1]TPJ57652.1 ABC transporter permease [Mesorhizobium sp. B2-6-1]
MIGFIVKRLILMVVVLVGIGAMTFALTHIVPGNPARLMAGQHATEEQVRALAERYGLDKPVLAQFWIYMTGLLHGDLGMSLTYRRPVLDDLRQFLPASIELTLAAVLLVVFIGLPVGLIAGVRRGKPLDHILRFLTVGGVSMPIFWLGIILQIFFYKQLQLLPIGGRLGIADIEPNQVTGFYLIDTLLDGDFDAFKSVLVHLILPASTLAVGSIAVISRMMRASVIEVLDADYVRTARAKGLSGGRVLRRHVFRNALVPTTTVLGLQIGALLAGNVLAEVVFNWPGIGLYAVNAIKNLDYPAIMGVTLIVSVIYVFINLLVDIAYVILDPRISLSGATQR